jgi:hypothetical protein
MRLPAGTRAAERKKFSIMAAVHAISFPESPELRIANRIYIAGVLQNTPDNMVRWIENPKAVNEKTVMPNLGVTPNDAGDIAGYLYTLQ